MSESPAKSDNPSASDSPAEVGGASSKQPIDPKKTHLATDLDAGSPLISCRFDPSGRFLFAGAQNSHIIRFSLADGSRTELTAHESWVRGMAFDPSGSTLYSGDYAGRLLMWPADAESPEPTRTVEAHQGWVRAVAVHPDGSMVATCGNDHLVKIWSASDGSLVRELRGHESHVYNVVFHPSGSALVSADLKGVVIHWDLETGESVRKLDAAKLYKYDSGFRADIGGIRGFDFRSDGARLAASGITKVTNAFAGVGNPAVLLFDWETGKEVQFLVSKGGLRGTAWAVDFHPDGFLIGASGGGGGGFLLFWKEDQPQEFHQLKLPAVLRDMDLHRDGLRIAVAHFDGHLRIYEMREAPAQNEKPKGDSKDSA